MPNTEAYDEGSCTPSSNRTGSFPTSGSPSSFLRRRAPQAFQVAHLAYRTIQSTAFVEKPVNCAWSRFHASCASSADRANKTMSSAYRTSRTRPRGFHIVKKMNEAIDKVRRGEVRRLRDSTTKRN